MPGTFSGEEIASLVAGLGSGYRPVRYWYLAGGVSACVAAVEVATGDAETTTVVVRLHSDWQRERDAGVARHEFELLDILHRAGLPVPQPVAVDDSTCEAPVLIVTYLPGQTLPMPEDAPIDPLPRAAAAAHGLAAVHAVDASAADHLPDMDGIARELVHEERERPNEAFDESTLRAALVPHWPPPQNNPTALLHGDYWPGNWLFDGANLVGLVDFEDAARGDPLADVAIARLELTWLWGHAAAQEFTERYCAATPVDTSALSVWDMFAALRMASGIEYWGFSDAVKRRAWEGHAEFAQRALAAVQGLP